MSALQQGVYVSSGTTGAVITIPYVAGYAPVIEFIDASCIGPATATVFNVYITEMKGYSGSVSNFWAPITAATVANINKVFPGSGLKAYGATNNTSAVTITARVKATIDAGSNLTSTTSAPITLLVGYRYEPA